MAIFFTRLTVVFISICSLSTYAQPSFQWGKRGGSGGSDQLSGNEEVLDMKTDRNGNVYVLAHNALSLSDVDGHPGISVRDRTVLASWDCAGNFRWHKVFGGVSNFSGRSLGIDTLGGVYVCGLLQNFQACIGCLPPYFDTDTTFSSYFYPSQYLIKYDTAGNFQWLLMPEPDTLTSVPQAVGFFSMDVSPSGHIYIYSRLAPGAYDGGAFSLSSKIYCVLEYDHSGTFQNLIPLDMATTNGGNAAMVDGQYNAFIANFARNHQNGRFYLASEYNRDFGTLSFGGVDINASGVFARPFYVAAFSSTGANIWTKQSSPDNGAAGIQLTIGDNGNIYVGGGTGDGNQFDNFTFLRSFGNAGGIPFVVALDGNGNGLWSSTGTCSGTTGVGGMSYVNNIVSVSSRYGDILVWNADTITTPFSMSGMAYIYLARLNAATGQILGLDSIPSDNTLGNNVSAVAADRLGNIYIGGSFESSLYIGSDTISKVGGIYDWFTAKFGSDNCDGATEEPTFAHSTIVNSSIVVYPNPAMETLIIEQAGNDTVLDVYTTVGQHVLRSVLIKDKEIIDISRLNAGMYLLHFKDKDGKQVSARMVKQ